MIKIKSYLFILSSRYIFFNLSIIVFLVSFLNLIELTRSIESDSIKITTIIYLILLKIPSILNETSPFIIIVSIAFLFRYLISNNELISMRNLGFSIFDIFQPIAISVFGFGLFILLFLNPITSITEIKYNKILNNQNEDMYSIHFSENSLWIKNISFNSELYYININKFDLKKMIAEDINILSINKKNNIFIQSKEGKISNKKFSLNKVNFFNIKQDNYEYFENLDIELNFSRESIINSMINYKLIPHYNYLNHIKTLKKFNLYSSAISLHYMSEILKPFFMILLSFVVMGFSAKYKRNENFFKVLFIALLIGFLMYIFEELVNKFTITFNFNFIYSYFIIFVIPFIIGLYKVIQIEND